MDLLQSVLAAQGGGAVGQLAKSFGLSEDQATSAVQHLLPALAAGMARNTTQQGGLDGLLAALAGGSHQKYVDDPSRLTAQETVQDGNGILGHILGSKDASRQLASRASADTGISADVLKKMLPLIATLAMGALSKQTASPRTQGSPPPQAGLLGMLTPLLDQNRDGSVADDVIGMLGRFLR